MNRVFKALADPTRRRVLELLRDKPLSAGEISDAFAVSRPTMSAHFAVLKEADLIEARREGKQIIYTLRLSVLEDALLSFTSHFGLSSNITASGGAVPKPTSDGDTA